LTALLITVCSSWHLDWSTGLPSVLPMVPLRVSEVAALKVGDIDSTRTLIWLERNGLRTTTTVHVARIALQTD